MSVYDIDINALDGEPDLLEGLKGKAALFVNVASKCGLTPQYTGLEKLHEKYEARGFTVLGFPCNQFLFQEPGNAEKIATFCSTKYGVTFPLYEKVKVKGKDQHPLYEVLSESKDDEGQAGNVKWNFEKFLISPDGEVLRRFRPRTVPEDPTVIAAIEEALPA